MNDELTTEHIPKTQKEQQEVGQLPIRELIGGLWWVALVSRPDIICALHKCAKWQNKPSQKLWSHLIHILKYLKHSIEYKIEFQRRSAGTSTFQADCDASFASEPKSKSRYGYALRFIGCLVAWSSSVMERVALSSTEAECGALVAVTKEGRWVREFVRELGTEVFRCEDEVLSLTQDNKSAISLTKKVGNHKRSKHFQVEFDALRQAVKGERLVSHM